MNKCSWTSHCQWSFSEPNFLDDFGSLYSNFHRNGFSESSFAYLASIFESDQHMKKYDMMKGNTDAARARPEINTIFIPVTPSCIDNRILWKHIFPTHKILSCCYKFVANKPLNKPINVCYISVSDCSECWLRQCFAYEHPICLAYLQLDNNTCKLYETAVSAIVV